MKRCALWALAAVAAHSQTATVQVDITPGHAINSFDPDSALGSSIDVLSRTGIDKVYTPHIVQEECEVIEEAGTPEDSSWERLTAAMSR